MGNEIFGCGGGETFDGYHRKNNGEKIEKNKVFTKRQISDGI